MPGIKNVLIVEDDTKLQLALKSRLERDGYKVFQAYNGQEGLEVLAKEQVDLALLDIAMPVMNGYEMLRKMRSEKKHDDVKVIIVSNSSYSILKSPEAAEFVKDIPYLIKSNYSLNEVVEKIEAV